MPALDPRDRLQRFVLRARKLMTHSLVREHTGLLNDLAAGKVTAKIQVNNRTGESTGRLEMQLPPEEAFESFAARLRPFMMSKESVYWSPVLDALEKLLTKETLAEVVDIDDLRTRWVRVVEGASVAQAYSVVTDKGQLSDVQLADLWLNSDALHAQPITSAVGKDLSLNQRYRAAAGAYARIGAIAHHTYYVVNHLQTEGLLDLDHSAFATPVLAETTISWPMEMYTSDVGAPLPTDLNDLDPEVWTPIHESLELLRGEGDPAIAPVQEVGTD